MIKLSIKIFCSFCRQKTSSLFLISVGMFISLLGIMFIYGRGRMVYETEARHNCETSTVEITAAISTSAAIQLYSKLMDNGTLPEITQALAYDDETATVGYYNQTDSRIGIPFGRYFTPEELNSGTVALLSDGYLAQEDISFIENMIESKIRISGHKRYYTVIGRYNSVLFGNPFYSKELLIPLHAYIEDEFPLNKLEIIFSTAPNRQQIGYLKSMLNELNVDYSLEPPKMAEFQAIKQFAKETFSHFIVLLICYVTLLNMLRYWIKSNLRKFYVYFLCGCSSCKLVLLLLANTCYLYSIALSFSILTFRLLEPYFSTYSFLLSLQIIDYLCIGLFALICALVTTLLVGIQQLRKFTVFKEISF